MTDNTLYKSDSFSFRRVGALFAYYFPTLRKQFFTYLGISMLFTALILIPVPDDMRTGFFTFLWTIIYWMWYLGPIAIVGKGRMETVDRLLPTKASEKLVFLLIWYVIVIPASLVVLPQFADAVIYPTLGDSYPYFKKFLDLQLHASWVMRTISILGNICASMGCLYAVLKSRHNKFLFGFLAVIAIQIFLGILGGIYSGYEMTAKAFKMGLEDGLAGTDSLSDLEFLEYTLDIVQPSPATYTVLGIIIAAILTFVALTYRRLRKPSL
ncbi:MAG: hypothetical protein K2H46_04680 [Muribaculaceae bacterium]|nr:hypothetical protein [Muribaculaceae bacterium]